MPNTSEYLGERYTSSRKSLRLIGAKMRELRPSSTTTATGNMTGKPADCRVATGKVVSQALSLIQDNGDIGMPPLSQNVGATFAKPQVTREIFTFGANRLFGQYDSFIVEGNPYCRPIRPQDLADLEFTAPLSANELSSPSALSAHRMLLNIYESDLLFLPKSGFETVERDFRLFYSDDVKLAGEAIRPTLERHVFAFLDQEIDVSGRWTLPAMKGFFENRLEVANKSDSALAAAVLAANSPDKAAHDFLVQLAGDFLTEASAMARNVLGNFGPPLSELFKVLIDEYGYGVHQTKHSTLFEELLESYELSSDVHAYWQFYLTSSLALTNYFHYVSRNHGNFFRYLGALYYTEATIPHSNRQFSKLLRGLFGSDANTGYFDEHVHIDPHHARMVVEKVIEPVIVSCGEGVIPEIVRGFEEFRLLQDIADEELIGQITWSDNLDEYCQKAKDLLSSPNSSTAANTQAFTEVKDELSVTHVHDDDELFVVSDGEIELVTGFDQSVRLGAGDGIVIPKGRLHGSVVLSDICSYWVSPLEFTAS